ncbi:MAG: Dolichyl-phosphate-mannose-protein mannosyltransferase [Candidatus Woesebacteria bacterium GW2011_GWA2_40_7]|nr:MAG: Dolichyl-phosphate-mannose-protein mannosyltransferase [Candidatus Woesebacteria bacterium GW2011_GWA2_40_7]KKS90772.1 MAG: Dolichyl-phosphate-mannose-protein mannosyltransferase [Candidatus Woesebacteria bacterium GW2011_GWA1_43_12]
MGFVVRLYKIQSPIADWHSWRQADTASVTRIYVENGINLIYPKFHDISSIQTGIFNPNGYRMVEFPFYNAIGAVLAVNFQSISLEILSRLVSIISAVTSGFFLYLIGKRFIGKWGGILSVFFYLFIPYNIYFTRVILPDPMGVTFGIISLWLFVRFFDDKGDTYLYLSGIFFAAMLLIKPYMGFYIVPICYLALKKYELKKIFNDRKILFKAITFFVLAFLPFILWRAWISRFPEGIPFYLWAFNGDRIRFKPSFWYWIFGERLGHLILGSMGLIPFVFGVFNTKVKNLFIHWFLAGIFMYVVAVASANVMHDYYQIPSIPVIALTLAAGSIYLWRQQTFNKWLVRIILVSSVWVMLITGWNQIAGNYNINHPEILAAGAEVDKITPKDAIVIAPYNGDTAFLYATKRSGWPAIDDSIDRVIEKGADYYVSVDLESADTKMMVSRFKTIEKTNKYIIIDLHQTVKTK